MPDRSCTLIARPWSPLVPARVLAALAGSRVRRHRVATSACGVGGPRVGAFDAASAAWMIIGEGRLVKPGEQMVDRAVVARIK